MDPHPAGHGKIKIEVDSILEKFDCPVCMCKMEKPTITFCGHSFCEACIAEVINRKHECPLCMKPLKSKDETIRNFALETLLKSLNE